MSPLKKPFSWFLIGESCKRGSCMFCYFLASFSQAGSRQVVDFGWFFLSERKGAADYFAITSSYFTRVVLQLPLACKDVLCTSWKGRHLEYVTFLSVLNIMLRLAIGLRICSI
jgi:hypothetical protein